MGGMRQEGMRHVQVSFEFCFQPTDSQYKNQHHRAPLASSSPPPLPKSSSSSSLGSTLAPLLCTPARAARAPAACAARTSAAARSAAASTAAAACLSAAPAARAAAACASEACSLAAAPQSQDAASVWVPALTPGPRAARPCGSACRCGGSSSCLVESRCRLISPTSHSCSEGCRPSPKAYVAVPAGGRTVGAGARSAAALSSKRKPFLTPQEEDSAVPSPLLLSREPPAPCAHPPSAPAASGARR